ncbi:hypothetical protein K466DRAFT_599488, partial [Polyporus arcularius HHB13444]
PVFADSPNPSSKQIQHQLPSRPQVTVASAGPALSSNQVSHQVSPPAPPADAFSAPSSKHVHGQHPIYLQPVFPTSRNPSSEQIQHQLPPRPQYTAYPARASNHVNHQFPSHPPAPPADAIHTPSSKHVQGQLPPRPQIPVAGTCPATSSNQTSYDFPSRPPATPADAVPESSSKQSQHPLPPHPQLTVSEAYPATSSNQVSHQLPSRPLVPPADAFPAPSSKQNQNELLPRHRATLAPCALPVVSTKSQQQRPLSIQALLVDNTVHTPASKQIQNQHPPRPEVAPAGTLPTAPSSQQIQSQQPHPETTLTGKFQKAQVYQRRIEGVPVLLHSSHIPLPGDVGYFLNGHVVVIEPPLQFITPRWSLVTRETVLDLFQSFEQWHESASSTTPEVRASSLTSKEMIFVLDFRATGAASASGALADPPSQPASGASKLPTGGGGVAFPQGHIHYYKIRRRWLPGQCNTTCHSVFPTRSLGYKVENDGVTYQEQPFDPVDELLTYIMNTPTDRDGVLCVPDKAIASVADLFALFKSFATMPNSIKAIHENLRKIEPRIRFIKGTQVAAFELACLQFERNSELSVKSQHSIARTDPPAERLRRL